MVIKKKAMCRRCGTIIEEDSIRVCECGAVRIINSQIVSESLDNFEDQTPMYLKG